VFLNSFMFLFINPSILKNLFIILLWFSLKDRSFSKKIRKPLIEFTLSREQLLIWYWNIFGFLSRVKDITWHLLMFSGRRFRSLRWKNWLGLDWKLFASLIDLISKNKLASSANSKILMLESMTHGRSLLKIKNCNGPRFHNAVNAWTEFDFEYFGSYARLPKINLLQYCFYYFKTLWCTFGQSYHGNQLLYLMCSRDNYFIIVLCKNKLIFGTLLLTFITISWTLIFYKIQKVLVIKIF